MALPAPLKLSDVRQPEDIYDYGITHNGELSLEEGGAIKG